MKRTLISIPYIRRLVMPFALLFFSLLIFASGLLSKAQAVNPPPDGGYPGGNTAEGSSALLSLTTGIYNTAVGLFTLESNAEGSFNTAIGAGALLANTADQNTATGAGALLSNQGGDFEAGTRNTANGAFALFSNTIGKDNTATGASTLFSNTQGAFNTAVGVIAMFSNTIGSQNTATGNNALRSNTTGDGNTALGDITLPNNTTGSANTAIGASALFDNTTGSTNIAIGPGAGGGVTTANNVISIGVPLIENVNDSCYIGSIFGQTSAGGTQVFINSSHKLGTITSSKRFKDDIKPIGKGSEAIFALKPVAFHYKREIDPAGTSQLGLVAEDVEQVNPDLVVRDNKGKPYSVRYDQVNAMLLNEFLKEHRKIEQFTKDFESKLAAQEIEIKTLISGLEKVTAQLEATKPTLRRVADNH